MFNAPIYPQETWFSDMNKVFADKVCGEFSEMELNEKLQGDFSDFQLQSGQDAVTYLKTKGKKKN